MSIPFVGGAVDESRLSDNSEPEIQEGDAFSKIFNGAWGDRPDDLHDEPEKPKAKQSKDLGALISEAQDRYDGEQEDIAAFNSSKGLAARDDLLGHWGDAGNFGNIIDSFLQIARDFKADPLLGAERFIRHFQANRFRTDRARELGIDRSAPEDEGRWGPLERLLQKNAELVERDDSLDKKQIRELKALFPGTPLNGILANIAEFNKLGLSDPMAAAGKLAFAFGAPRTEAELQEWEQRQPQLAQQQAYAAQAQAQFEQQLQAEARELLVHPQFQHRRTGDFQRDFTTALAFVQEYHANEQREVQEAHGQIARFQASGKAPFLDQVRPTMAALLQHGHADTLEQAYQIAARPLIAAERERQASILRARKALPVKSSTGSYASGRSAPSGGLDHHLSAAIDRHWN